MKTGVRHEVATRLAAAIQAKDAAAGAATFGSDGVLHRWRGEDVRGPAVERVFRQAFDLCTMRVASILERATSFVMQLESTCTHPKMSGPQNHLIVADVDGETIVRASVWTELFAAKQTGDPIRREIEDPSTLSESRERAVRCWIDSTRKLLPADFQGPPPTVWATPTCSVLTITQSDGKQNIQIDCKPRVGCLALSPDTHQYVDHNGYKLLPFADEVYR